MTKWLDKHLHPEWRKILTKADSIKWMAVALVLTALEVYFSVYGAPLGIPQGTFALLSGFTTAGAFYFRLKAQKEFQNADQ
jgi:hypothetical protein